MFADAEVVGEAVDKHSQQRLAEAAWWKQQAQVTALQDGPEVKLMLEHFRATSLPKDLFGVPKQRAGTFIDRRGLSHALAPAARNLAALSAPVPLPLPSAHAAAAALPIVDSAAPTLAPVPLPSAPGAATSLPSAAAKNLQLQWEGECDGDSRQGLITVGADGSASDDVGLDADASEENAWIFFKIVNASPQSTNRPFKSTDAVGAADMIAEMVGETIIDEPNVWSRLAKVYRPGMFMLLKIFSEASAGKEFGCSEWMQAHLWATRSRPQKVFAFLWGCRLEPNQMTTTPTTCHCRRRR
jgi:hypothetical protein